MPKSRRAEGGAGDEPIDGRRRLAFGAGAAALGALALPKNAEAADAPSPFSAIKRAGAVGDGVTDDTAAFVRFDAAGGGWLMPYAASGTMFCIAGRWAPRHRVIIGPGIVLKLGADAEIMLADLVILDDAQQCFDLSDGGRLRVDHVNRMSPFCFGAKGDGASDDTAAFAHFDSAGGGIIAPLSNAGTNFYLNGAWSPSHRVTIAPGAVIKAGPHANIALADLVLPDDATKAFDGSLGGIIAIAKVDRLTPYHFGAAGHGAADDTAACAAAMKAVPANGEMRFPAGTFAIGANLPRTRTGVTVRGERAKIVKKMGARSIHLFTAATGNRFLGLDINAGETAPFSDDTASFGIYNDPAAPAADVEVAHCVFNDIWNAIRCDGARNWNIHDNSGAVFFQAILAYHSTSAPISGLRIAGNNFRNMCDAGFAIDPVTGNAGAASFIEVSGNIVEDTNLGPSPQSNGYAIDLGEDGTANAVTDVLVHGNLVRQAGASYGSPAATRGAISVSYITRASVRDNICVGLGGAYSGLPISEGISAFAAETSVIADNEVSNFIGDGINVWGTHHCDVLDNLTVNCGSRNAYAGISVNIVGSGVTTVNCRIKGNRVTVLSGYANATTAAGIFCAGNTRGKVRNAGIAITDNLIENITTSPGIQVNGNMAGEEILVERVTGNTLINCISPSGAISLSYTIGVFVSGNMIHGAVVGMGGSDNADMQIVGNYFYDDSGVAKSHINFIRNNVNCRLLGNVFRDGGAGAAITAPGMTMLHNVGAAGAATDNAGIAVIAANSTSVTVQHGLAVAPTAGQISVTPNGNIAPASQFWVSGIGPRSFTIHLNAAPAAAVTFGWSARLT